MKPGTRSENAVDFWRGLALVMIFIDHIPGNIVSHVTLRNFAISDAAELFVLLAGWSCSYATGGPRTPDPTHRVAFRLLSRAVEIYRAQIVISAIALAMLAGMAISRGNPLYLEWHNASGAFYDPVRAIVGSALLSYQLSYFNILPLYVAILLVAPAFIFVARRSLIAVVILSYGIYLGAIFTHTNLPSWPVENSWYFNPLSWQVLFVTGFVAAELSERDSARERSCPPHDPIRGGARACRAHRAAARILARPAQSAGAAAAVSVRQNLSVASPVTERLRTCDSIP